MSREIKFRIWDNINNEWLGENDKDSLTFYGFHLVGEVMSVQCPPHWALDNGNIVEQYTGLKDKNRKEIYVGDIVSEHNGDIVGEIIQKPSGEYCIAWIGIYGGSSVLYDELSMCEVIGNIHENPELLSQR